MAFRLLLYKIIIKSHLILADPVHFMQFEARSCMKPPVKGAFKSTVAMGFASTHVRGFTTHPCKGFYNGPR